MFRLPAGTLFAVLGAGICAVLITGVNLGGSFILLATALVAFINWLLVRGRPEGTALLS
jgi:hypothetical protein